MSNQQEASSSDDDMESEDQAMDEFAAAVLEEEMGPNFRDVIAANTNPDVRREQDIVAEVARRREALERGPAETKRKSDEIFARFDADGDGHLNFDELRALGQATGGDLVQARYKMLCEEIGANPKKGITAALLLIMYTDAGLGDAHRDYNLVFPKA
jgi:hypothetical protein